MAGDKNGIRKAWSDLSVKVKVIGGVITILTAFLAVHPYLPASMSLGQAIAVEAADREEAVAAEATDREQADLETQLDIVDIQIQIYLNKQAEEGLTPYEQDRLDLAIKRRDRLIERLDNILA